MNTTIVALLSFLSLLIVSALIKLFHDLWWVPNRLRRLMGSQGITGPPYRFIHGSTKEMTEMKNKAKPKPLGLSHDLVPILLPHVHPWTKSYGKNYIQWFGPKAQLVVTETELVKEIFNNRDKLFPKTKLLPFIRKILGDGLVGSEGEKWSKMRKLANHAFQAENVKRMLPLMVTSVEAMMERWEGCDGREIEVFEEFRLLTSDVISRTAFGSSWVEGKTIFEMLERLNLLASRNLLKQSVPGVSKIFKSSDEKESDKIEKRINYSMKKIIEKRENKIANGEEDGLSSDFLGVLLKAHHDPDKKQSISVADMIDECKTFYVAGQETTTLLLTWTVLLLAMNTDWQEEARKEVTNLFGKQTPKPDGLLKLKCLSMIINESLRLYPPVITLSRRVEREGRLGELNLPAGILLQIPVLAIHHDPKIWGDDALLFKPERFSEGVAKATRDNIAAFLPFGMGPRICAGFNFAVTEAKIALAIILQRYTFTLSPGYIHSPTQRLTVRPQHGLQVILNRC